LSEQIPQLLRELEFAEASHFDLMPWLRAILEPVSFGGDMLQQRARRINRALLDLEAGKA